MKIHILTISCILILFVALSSCAPSPKGENNTSAEKRPEGNSEAVKLISTMCISCHGETGVSDRIAPTLSEIRNAYLSSTQSREEFVAAMGSFLLQPAKSATLMPGAVEKYGPMPAFTYREADVITLVDYLYENESASNDFLEGEMVREGRLFEELALEFANSTKAVLGKNLLAAIQKYGSAGAVDFCSTRAIPITDSMAVNFGVSIKRVSDKPRNPRNAPNTEEAAYIAALKAAKTQGKELPSFYESREGIERTYFVIETNAMCLQCHGAPGTDVNAETLAAIRSKYPADMATGYGVNEVRGIWVVERRR